MPRTRRAIPRFQKQKPVDKTYLEMLKEKAKTSPTYAAYINKQGTLEVVPPFPMSYWKKRTENPEANRFNRTNTEHLKPNPTPMHA